MGISKDLSMERIIVEPMSMYYSFLSIKSYHEYGLVEALIFEDKYIRNNFIQDMLNVYSKL